VQPHAMSKSAENIKPDILAAMVHPQQKVNPVEYHRVEIALFPGSSGKKMALK
jgi:hypothetical protein